MARSSWSAVALVVAAVVLLTLPGALASGGGGGPSSPALAPPPPGPTTNASLTLEAGHNLSSLFWGTTVSPRSRLLPNEGSLTTGTPVSVVVWPGAFAGDEYDPLGNMARGLTWTPNNQATTPLTNESQFVTWCKAIHCAAILQVSGEIDNPSIAADVVAYTVNKTYTGPVWETNGTEVNVTIPGLDFRPVAWEIGNEPALWAYWDEPWGQWHPYQTPNSAQYAQEENAYFLAMDHANSSYRPGIIGLPGIGRADSLDSPATWVNNVISENGPNLTGIATHIYPARNLPSGQSGLVQFYDQISPNDPSSFLARTEDYAVPVAAACRIYICGPDGNSTLPIYVTEVGTSLSHTVFGGYSVGFPGALGMAMEGIEAMSFPNTTVASIDLFQSVADTNNGWFNNSGGGRPTYTLYSRIFTHLGTDAFPVNVTGDTNVSAIATVAPNDSDRRDLLVTNENITTSASFNLGFLNRSWYAPGTAPLPTFAAGSPVEVWEWNATTPSYNYTTGLTSSDPQTPVPVATYYNHGLPVNWTLPPQSMALFETYNAPAYPVNFTADLTPPGSTTPIPHWFIQVDGWNISSTEASETLLLPPGEHVTSGTPLLTPEDGTDQKSRWVPNLPPIITTGNAWAWVNFSYIRQWAVAISWNGSRGTVLLLASASASAPPSDGGLTWWNDSQPLQLEFQTDPGYAFDRWDGAGSGGYSGYSLFATLTPTGPVEEKAVFLPGTEVTYSETGLTSGTPWSVSLRDYSLTTTNTTLTFYEAPGNWSDQISNVSGYRTDHAGRGRLVAALDHRGRRAGGPARPLLPHLPSGTLLHPHLPCRRPAGGRDLAGNGPERLGVRRLRCADRLLGASGCLRRGSRRRRRFHGDHAPLVHARERPAYGHGGFPTAERRHLERDWVGARPQLVRPRERRIEHELGRLGDHSSLERDLLLHHPGRPGLRPQPRDGHPRPDREWRDRGGAIPPGDLLRHLRLHGLARRCRLPGPPVRLERANDPGFLWLPDPERDVHVPT